MRIVPNAAEGADPVEPARRTQTRPGARINSIRIARLKPRGHARVTRLLKELNAVMSEEHDPDGEAFALTYQLSPFAPS